MELLNINEFIEKNELKEIKSPEIFVKNTEIYHPEGVYSEEIFGKIGTEKRNNTFAYINLKQKFIHPEVFDIIKKFIPNHSQVFSGKQSLGMNNKNIIITTNGNEYTCISGVVKFFIDNKDKINWDYYKERDEKSTKFILDNFDKIFVDKWIVIPAGIRDIQEINKQKQEQEISKLYRRLIYLVNTLQINTSSNNNNDNNDSLTTEFISALQPEININCETELKIQNTLQQIVNYIYNLLKSKSGIIRGNKLSKRVDHEARLVLGHDSNLNPDEVGIPWFILLKLYEPFVMHYITKDPRYSDIYTAIENEYDVVSIDTMRRYLTNIVRYPKNVDKHIKSLFIDMLQKIINGEKDGVEKYLIVIRHPVESRDSILGMKPVIIEDDIYVGKLPQVVFSALGADVDGDSINIYALHTKSAIEEAKKMSPVSKLGRYSTSKYGSLRLDPSMDMALGVWMLTK